MKENLYPFFRYEIFTITVLSLVVTPVFPKGHNLFLLPLSYAVSRSAGTLKNPEQAFLIALPSELYVCDICYRNDCIIVHPKHTFVCVYFLHCS